MAKQSRFVLYQEEAEFTFGAALKEVKVAKASHAAMKEAVKHHSGDRLVYYKMRDATSGASQDHDPERFQND
jgi:hypothetical protein